MKLSLESISIEFSGFSVKNFSLEAPSGSFTCIVGPSGCGKTTILRVIAGLEKQSSGKVLFGGKDVSALPPEQRNIGLVFQQDALFPHLNVLGNVSFGAEVKKFPNPKEAALRALELVHMKSFASRDVSKLSGGERKRVAIARALASKPSLLLLDEPLSGLDAKLRESTKRLIAELCSKESLTVVMVTHDIDEAFALSDKVIVMNRGAIEQSGTALEIFRKPKTAFVKDFVSDYVLADASKIKGFSRGKRGVALLKKTSVRDS